MSSRFYVNGTDLSNMYKSAEQDMAVDFVRGIRNYIRDSHEMMVPNNNVGGCADDPIIRR